MRKTAAVRVSSITPATYAPVVRRPAGSGRGERSERGPQLGERTDLDLAHALARDPELGADLGERHLGAADAEVALEDPALARREHLERAEDLQAADLLDRGIFHRRAVCRDEPVLRLLVTAGGRERGHQRPYL